MTYDKRASFELAKSAGLATDRFPETKHEADIAEDVLAKELAALSLEEHEKALFDVHGISGAPEESDELLEQKLLEFDVEISKIKHKDAYNIAKSLGPDYVDSRELRLMFLRSELFEATAAAEKLVLHFERKRELFGQGDVLGRDVRQSDLSEKERKILESGFFQALPSRDAAGRCIFVLNTAGVEAFPEEWDIVHESRPMWYLSMIMLKDEETQRNGCVFVIFNYNSYKSPLQNFLESFENENAMPRKLVGGHICYSDSELRPYISGFKIFVNKHDRFRIRTHFGSHDNILFELQTYGIPTEELPMSTSGSILLDRYQESLRLLRRDEALALPDTSLLPSTSSPKAKSAAILIPRRFDVLFGKHMFARQHTGTLRALHLVEMHYDTYEKANKYQKTVVAEKIMSMVHESGGRFMKQVNQEWKQVPDVEARQKVAHWFRHSRHKRSRESSSQTPIGSNISTNKRVLTSETPQKTLSVPIEKLLFVSSGPQPKLLRSN